ncbi:MAG: hypothetical protein AAGC63_06630 [Propionicimonas sp.]|nr:hypothetical protein [Propionicimonas sp.]
MSQPVVQLIAVVGEMGAACEGDDCLLDEAVAPDRSAPAHDGTEPADTAD